MPQKATRTISQSDDDEDEVLSQYSKAPDSDDRELELYAKAVAEFKVSWQKQKQEKERRFLKSAQAELDDLMNRKRGELDEIMGQMDDIYQDFLSRYTAIEDRKREVLVQIAEKQKILLAISVKKHQEAVEHVQNLEEGQREGIRLVAQSCQDMQGMIDAFMKV
ncbi:hypothetical protein JVU11DRAFT_13084 [Chiua virens]|nr:hypothetical protein JVU11DRAFT_13084 [Chiua virens]